MQFFLIMTVIIIFSYFLSKFLLFRLFETNNLLDLLLKNTLHELNIPLSVIKANTQMLKLKEKDKKVIQKLERINKACSELYGLYEDIDYYIKKERRADIREDFALDNLLEAEVEKFKNLYQDIDISLGHTNLQVFMDKRGFRKVISNLLSNALKYNRDNNRVEIYLSGKRVVIQDYGIGMNESELFMVFNRYYQSKSENRGFGIGLNIVKTFCDENKIFINIQSKPNVGTKISLDLSNSI